MDPEPVAVAADTAEAPEAAEEAEARPGRSTGFGVALLLAAAAIVAAVITARASMLGGHATDLWYQSVREEERRGALLIQGVRFAYGEVGDVAFMIATSQARAQALQEAAASAAPEIADDLKAEARIHTQVADAMQSSVEFGNDPRFMLPSGGYDLQASLADERSQGGDDKSPDPLVSIAEADEASAQAIRILSVAIVVGVVFLLGALAQTIASRRRILLSAGWVTLGVAVLLAIGLELTA